MNERIEMASPREIELREAFRRLYASVSSIGVMVDDATKGRLLPEESVDWFEVRAGRAIRELIQDHLRTYMVGPSTIRGLGRMDLGCLGSVYLSMDGKDELYDVLRMERKIRHVEPLPDREWYRNWEGVVGAATTMKAY